MAGVSSSGTVRIFTYVRDRLRRERLVGAQVKAHLVITVKQERASHCLIGDDVIHTARDADGVPSW